MDSETIADARRVPFPLLPARDGIGEKRRNQIPKIENKWPAGSRRNAADPNRTINNRKAGEKSGNGACMFGRHYIPAKPQAARSTRASAASSAHAINRTKKVRSRVPRCDIRKQNNKMGNKADGEKRKNGFYFRFSRRSDRRSNAASGGILLHPFHSHSRPPRRE